MATARSALVGESDDKASRKPRRKAVAGSASGGEGPRKQPLYASRQRIHARSIQGTFRRIKWAALWVLLGLYYIGPWLRWDRGPGAPDQALLVDLPGRRLYFFFVEIWPQEVYYLTGLLIIGAVGLFLATALFGRVWCGFTCPQTVWTDLFMWVERRIEGDRNARIRLDRAKWTLGKLGKKLAKHLAWMLIAFATGGAWIMYFVDAPTLVREFFTGQASVPVYAFTFLFTATTYVLAGWAREQVCIYMCPWPRFQSAMFDEDSLLVTYEAWRGEPRGPARKGQSFEGRGDCVDCGLCWQVCPTGVDIRNGQQMACIGCALCVDACNGVMRRFGLPPGLITYDSINNQLAREHGRPTALRLIRPRTLVYAAVLVLVTGVMAFSLATRSRLEINVLPDRAPLYVRLSDGSIRNGYTVKLLNMERKAKTYLLTTDGIKGARLTVIGHGEKDVTSVALPAKPDDVNAYRVFVTAPRASLAGGRTPLSLVLTDTGTGQVVQQPTVFEGPPR